VESEFRNERTVSEAVDELAEVVHAHLLQVQPFLVGRRSTVFLTREQVERILSTKECVIVHDLNR